MSKFKLGTDGIHIARLTIEVEDFSDIDKINLFIADNNIKLHDSSLDVFDQDYQSHDYYPIDDGNPDDCEQCDEGED